MLTSDRDAFQKWEQNRGVYAHTRDGRFVDAVAAHDWIVWQAAVATRNLSADDCWRQSIMHKPFIGHQLNFDDRGIPLLLAAFLRDLRSPDEINELVTFFESSYEVGDILASFVRERHASVAATPENALRDASHVTCDTAHQAVTEDDPGVSSGRLTHVTRDDDTPDNA